MKTFTWFLFSVFSLSYSFCANIEDTLYIKAGLIAFNDGVSIDAKTFSSTSVFEKESKLLIWNLADDVSLTIINQDNQSHGFIIEDLVDFGTINPDDTVTELFTLTSSGIKRYYDPLNSPYNEYLGLAGIVHVKEVTDNVPYFYWDVREHRNDWNSLIVSGATPSLLSFDPNYFTINGNQDPDIDSDVVAKVTGNVGSELRIVMVNNGLSIHSMHFHGYHSTLMYNSKDASHQGRSKDTFPLYPKETIVLSLTPDKPGEYPVHDHNLVSVTGGGIYHAGMFTTLLIAP